MKYIENGRDSIKRNATALDNFVERLIAPNPELTNKILAKFPLNECFERSNFAHINSILLYAKTNPEIVEKVLQMKNINPEMQMAYISMFVRGAQKQTVSLIKSDALKITDELFNYYLEFEKANPKATTPWTLNFMNKLLNKSDVDEKFVKELL